ncbi:hypothetical protein SISNIDRAFT_453345 [Sistotremastrum niveocremeum HHB9708]|uniref:Mus7/MMS22 family-domain-containing protein n=1 Tax=Sistotremastrum niveocremeum HHB9708 TaxID=1314777 RepID=A0A164VSW3_9AGAM|nr:hypothetical protein SISNIDRAFT_453345 [Sistotremastrum niveocremeum HHB9708]
MSSFEIVDDVEEIVDTSDAEEQAEFQTTWLHLKRHTSPTNADIGKDVRAFPRHALILDNQPSTSSLLEHEVDNDRDEMDFLTQFQPVLSQNDLHPVPSYTENRSHLDQPLFVSALPHQDVIMEHSDNPETAETSLLPCSLENSVEEPMEAGDSHTPSERSTSPATRSKTTVDEGGGHNAPPFHSLSLVEGQSELNHSTADFRAPASVPFTPPYRLTPPFQTADQEAALPSGSISATTTPLMTRVVHDTNFYDAFKVSSPLTPPPEDSVICSPHSPVDPFTSPRSRSSPLQARASSGSSSPPPPQPTSPAAQIEEGNPFGRYQLRNRSNKQLNPYEYDRRMYRKALQAVPEAIVKYKSPERRTTGNFHAVVDPEAPEFLAEESQESQLPYPSHILPPDSPSGLYRGRRENLAVDAEPASRPVVSRKRPRDVSPVSEALSITSIDGLYKYPRLPPFLSLLPSKVTHHSKPKPIVRRTTVSPEPNYQEGTTFPSEPTTPPRTVTPHLDDSSLSSPANHNEETAGWPEEDNILLRPSSPVAILDDVQLGKKTSPVQGGRNETISINGDDHSPGTSGRDLPIDLASSSPMPTVSKRQKRPRSHSPINVSSDSNHDSDDSEGRGSSGSNSSPLGEGQAVMSKKDRARMKALMRMMPAAMAKRVIMGKNQQQAHRRATARKRTRSLSASSDGLQPGQSRLRPGHQASTRLSGLRLDSESSSSAADEPDAQTPQIAAARPPSDVEEESEDGLDDHDITTWLGNVERGTSPAHRSSETRNAPHWETDLIDRMLTRTRRIGDPGTSSRSSKRKRLGQSRRRSHNPRLRHHHQPKDSEDREKRQGPEMTPVAHTERNPSRAHHKRKHPKGNTEGTPILVKRGSRQPSRWRHVVHIVDSDSETGDINAVERALAPLSSKSSAGSRRGLNTQAQTSLDSWIVEGSRFDDVPFDVEPELIPSRIPSPPVVAASSITSAKLSLDYDVDVLKAGTTIESESYVGRGYLKELLDLKDRVGREFPLPHAFVGFGLTLTSKTEAHELHRHLPNLFDSLYDWASDSAPQSEGILGLEVNSLLRFVSTYVTSVTLGHGSNDQIASLLNSLSEQINRLLARIRGSQLRDPGSLKPRQLWLLWIAVDMAIRINEKGASFFTEQDSLMFQNSDDWKHCLRELLEWLLSFGFDGVLESLRAEEDVIPAEATNGVILQIWISILHLLPRAVENGPAGARPSLSLLPLIQLYNNTHKNLNIVETSESMWQLIFAYCALCQFTPYGSVKSLTDVIPQWPAVLEALSFVRLEANPEVDKNQPASVIERRDVYVRLVIWRCLILCTKWQWRLQEAYSVIMKLSDIFRTRNFANLSGESSDFPLFIREFDIHILDTWTRRDTAFGSFLKLVVRFNRDTLEALGERVRAVKTIKVLSAIVPVGTTPFSRDNPPLRQELSKIFNRFTCSFLAIFLDPSKSNMELRIGQSRRYVIFKNADQNSRIATIRAMMYLSVLLRHSSLPLDEIFSWATDMTKQLLEEITTTMALKGRSTEHPSARSRTAIQNAAIIALQILLGCMRVSLQTQSFDANRDREKVSPDVRYLHVAVAWIEAYSRQTVECDIRTIGEIMKLLDAFVCERVAAMPSATSAAPDGNSEESQEDYGFEDWNMDDPALIAALHENGPSDASLQDPDAETVRLMDKVFIPFICDRFYKTSSSEGSATFGNGEYDKWIDCWVSCAQIVVRHGQKAWLSYCVFGDCSWGRISDPSTRYKVGLRFLFRLLQVDINAYKTMKERFFDFWFQALATSHVTIEHEYSSRLFEADAMKHGILRQAFSKVAFSSRDFAPTQEAFKANRLHLLDAICGSLSESLGAMNTNDQATRSLCNEGCSHVMSLLSAIENNLHTSDHAYLDFCNEVLTILQTHSLSHTDHRIGDKVRLLQVLIAGL